MDLWQAPLATGSLFIVFRQTRCEGCGVGVRCWRVVLACGVGVRCWRAVNARRAVSGKSRDIGRNLVTLASACTQHVLSRRDLSGILFISRRLGLGKHAAL